MTARLRLKPRSDVILTAPALGDSDTILRLSGRQQISACLVRLEVKSRDLRLIGPLVERTMRAQLPLKMATKLREINVKRYC